MLQCAQWLVTSLVTALVLVAAAIDILRLLRLLVRVITLRGNAALGSQRMPEGGGLGHVRIRHADGVGGRTCGAGLAIGWRELRRRRRRRSQI